MLVRPGNPSCPLLHSSLPTCLLSDLVSFTPETFHFGAIRALTYPIAPDAKPILPESPSQGDQTLLLALDALAAADYSHAVSFANEAIDQGISWKEGEAEAYNLRGTFKFLIGDSEGARADLEKSLDLKPDFVQSWVKIASVHMELGTFQCAMLMANIALTRLQVTPSVHSVTSRQLSDTIRMILTSTTTEVKVGHD